MKKLSITLFALFLMCSGFSQTVYWTVYNMKVANGQEQNVVNAMDKFMNTEAGKSMPAMSFTGKLFGNSEQTYTHQVIFGTTDKSVLGKMYTGVLQQTTDFQLLGSILSAHTESAGSYLGKSLYAIGNTQGNYSAVLSLDIKNPPKYLEAFKAFATSANATWGDDIGIALHQVLSGNEEDVTHVVVISCPTFESLLDFTDKVYSTPAFATLNAAVKDIRSVVSNSTTVTFKRYNTPE